MAERSGMEVSQAKLDLTQAKDALTKARVTIHSFNVGRVEADIKPGLAAAAKDYEAGRKALAERNYRRIGLASAILERDPEPISTVNPLAPRLLDHIVRRSLAKNPEERWQSAQDLKLELEWVRQAGSQASAPALAGGMRKSNTVLVLTAALALTAIVLALAYFLFPSKPAPAVWANLNLGGELIDEEGNFALSPDGQKVAYVAATAEGSLKLWVRDLRSPKSQPLEGTEVAELPFWSPDNKSIAFFSTGKLKRVDANGERLQSICDAVNGRGGTWNRDGTIVFAA